MRHLILSVFVILGLAACAQTPPPPKKLPDITFQHLAPIYLDVATIDIVDQKKAVTAGRNVSAQYPTSPRKALGNWVRDRLQAGGSSGSARVVVHEASAVEEKLRQKGGVTGLFTTDLSEKYTTTLDVTIEFFDTYGQSRGFAKSSANRFITVQEDISLTQRETQWFEMVEKLMADFDTAMADKLAPFRVMR